MMMMMMRTMMIKITSCSSGFSNFQCSFCQQSQGWAWNINHADEVDISFTWSSWGPSNINFYYITYYHNIRVTSWRFYDLVENDDDDVDDDDDLDNSEELLPCHWILNGPKCWYQSPYTTIGHTQYVLCARIHYIMQQNTPDTTIGHKKFTVQYEMPHPAIGHTHSRWRRLSITIHVRPTSLLWPVFEYLMA